LTKWWDKGMAVKRGPDRATPLKAPAESEVIEQARKFVDDASRPVTTERLPFDSTAASFRALDCRPLFPRADLGLWGALVQGADAEFRLKRRFLPKLGDHALDLAPAVVGSVLELAGYVGEGKERRRYAVVVELAVDAVVLRWLDNVDAALKMIKR
jgi:hypothetical protein